MEVLTPARSPLRSVAIIAKNVIFWKRPCALGWNPAMPLVGGRKRFASVANAVSLATHAARAPEDWSQTHLEALAKTDWVSMCDFFSPFKKINVTGSRIGVPGFPRSVQHPPSRACPAAENRETDTTDEPGSGTSNSNQGGSREILADLLAEEEASKFGSGTAEGPLPFQRQRLQRLKRD